MIYKWNGIITCLAPLAHNSDENMGIDVKFRRMKHQSEDGYEMIPVYSGNAFRGILRRIAALDFFNRIGIDSAGDERISDRLYYTCFSGGSLQKGSSSTGIEVGFRREMRRLVPFLGLFGTAFVNQIIPGKMSVGIAVPIADETEHITSLVSDKSVWSLVEEIFYTRRDDLDDKTEKREAHESAQQMRYTIECLSAGTELAHEFTLRHPTELELSCFGSILRTFLKNPVLGGKSGTGHGQVQLRYDPKWPSAKPYYAFIKENREEIRNYIREAESRLAGKVKEKAS